DTRRHLFAGQHGQAGAGPWPHTPVRDMHGLRGRAWIQRPGGYRGRDLGRRLR
ncbi:MAG: hypothetical protein AVDCRST_MAG80-2630, partial [uncultured Rubrobacteraceae bacterium]